MKNGYGRPRIAAPSNPNNFKYKDYSAVLNEFDVNNNKWNLLSITRFRGQHSPLFIANEYPDITSAECKEPAITYINKDILISFKTNNQNPDFDIYQKKLNYKGDPQDYWYYSLVNISPSGKNSSPSICGRFAPQNKALYTFFDGSIDQILFKTSYVGNKNLRKPMKINENIIYPNPVINNSLTIHLDNIGLVDYYEIYNINGKVLISQKISNKYTKMNLSKLSKGVYYIKIFNNNEIIIKKFIIN
jgi:hypothetical protein